MTDFVNSHLNFLQPDTARVGRMSADMISKAETFGKAGDVQQMQALLNTMADGLLEQQSNAQEARRSQKLIAPLEHAIREKNVARLDTPHTNRIIAEAQQRVDAESQRVADTETYHENLKTIIPQALLTFSEAAQSHGHSDAMIKETVGEAFWNKLSTADAKFASFTKQSFNGHMPNEASMMKGAGAAADVLSVPAANDGQFISDMNEGKSCFAEMGAQLVDQARTGVMPEDVIVGITHALQHGPLSNPTSDERADFTAGLMSAAREHPKAAPVIAEAFPQFKHGMDIVTKMSSEQGYSRGDFSR